MDCGDPQKKTSHSAPISIPARPAYLSRYPLWLIDSCWCSCWCSQGCCSYCYPIRGAAKVQSPRVQAFYCFSTPTDYTRLTCHTGYILLTLRSPFLLFSRQQHFSCSRIVFRLVSGHGQPHPPACASHLSPFRPDPWLADSHTSTATL